MPFSMNDLVLAFIGTIQNCFPSANELCKKGNIYLNILSKGHGKLYFLDSVTA